MEKLFHKLRKLFLLKIRFALTSSVATFVDYSLYLVLVYTVLTPVPSQVVSASCGMVINFFLQKRFVFNLQRKVRTAFLMAVLVSIGGIGLGALIISLLIKIPFFETYQPITKLVTTGLVFFYNFYFKRYVFEKRFFEVD